MIFVARMLNAFFSTAGQAGSLIFIKDVFFLHEYARMINIWGFAIILAPEIGPCLAAFMLSTQRWELPFWIYAGEVGVSVIAIVMGMEETYYDRHIPIHLQSPRQSRFMHLMGLEQFRSRNLRKSFGQAIIRPFRACSKFRSSFRHYTTLQHFLGQLELTSP